MNFSIVYYTKIQVVEQIVEGLTPKIEGTTLKFEGSTISEKKTKNEGDHNKQNIHHHHNQY